jgi:hypothetical protein
MYTIPVNRYFAVGGTSASDVFATGNAWVQQDMPDARMPWTVHYNGSTWSHKVMPTDSSGIYLSGFWGSSSSDVFAIGNGGTILHYDGIVTTTTTVRPTTTSSTTTTVPATVINLIDFNAIPGNRIVTLAWSTAGEIDNAGFNLYRSESKDGEYIKINDALIVAQGTSTQGASYEFVDNEVQNRKPYYYKLEDIDLNGQSTMHGPVSATQD